MTLSPNSVLYYPYIDIKNEEWLRNSILYWDKIKTIVPDGFEQPYSSKISRLLQDEGILEPLLVNSSMNEIEDLCDDVLEYLTDPSSASILFGQGLEKTSQIHPRKLPEQILEIADIHPMKLPYIIREHLYDNLSDRGFLRVDSGFAGFYMTILAGHLSNRFGLGLATDIGPAEQFANRVRKGKAIRSSDLSDSRRYDYRNRANKGQPREIANGAMFELMMKGINLPINIPIKDLIKFRKTHQCELANLRREISKLVSDIPENASTEALRQAVSDQYTNSVVPALNSLKKSLSMNGWDTAIGGLLKISFISVASTSMLSILNVPTPIALLAGTGLSLTATATSFVGQQRRVRETNPYSYLLALDRKW